MLNRLKAETIESLKVWYDTSYPSTQSSRDIRLFPVRQIIIFCSAIQPGGNSVNIPTDANRLNVRRFGTADGI